MPETITIAEGEAPLLTFQAKEALPDGTRKPYLLTAVTAASFYTKLNPDDTAKLFEYTLGAGITITDTGADPTDKFSELTVQVSAAHTVTPRSLYFWLFVSKGTRVDKIKSGFLRIENA